MGFGSINIISRLQNQIYKPLKDTIKRSNIIYFISKKAKYFQAIIWYFL